MAEAQSAGKTPAQRSMDKTPWFRRIGSHHSISLEEFIAESPPRVDKVLHVGVDAMSVRLR